MLTPAPEQSIQQETRAVGRSLAVYLNGTVTITFTTSQNDQEKKNRQKLLTISVPGPQTVEL